MKFNFDYVLIISGGLCGLLSVHIDGLLFPAIVLMGLPFFNIINRRMNLFFDQLNLIFGLQMKILERTNNVDNNSDSGLTGSGMVDGPSEGEPRD